MHFVLWFIYLVNEVLYSAPLHSFNTYDECTTAKEDTRFEMTQDYPGDTMFFVCLDQAEI